MIAGKGFYQLPILPNSYGSLAPSIFEQLLKVRHDRHHRKYLSEAHSLLEKMDKVRVEGSMPIMRSEALGFNVGGHILHSLYWNNNIWEHACFLDHKNEKAKYTSNFWNNINRDEVDRRLEKILGGRKEGAVQKAVAGVSP